MAVIISSQEFLFGNTVFSEIQSATEVCYLMIAQEIGFKYDVLLNNYSIDV
jgi:hypothetical protein